MLHLPLRFRCPNAPSAPFPAAKNTHTRRLFMAQEVPQGVPTAPVRPLGSNWDYIPRGMVEDGESLPIPTFHAPLSLSDGDRIQRRWETARLA